MSNYTSNHAIVTIDTVASRLVIFVEKRGGNTAHKTTRAELRADVERIVSTLRECGYSVDIESGEVETIG